MVGTNVMFATHSWFGCSTKRTKKLRRTRPDAGLSAGLGRVVRMLLLRLAPVIPAAAGASDPGHLHQPSDRLVGFAALRVAMATPSACSSA